MTRRVLRVYAALLLVSAYCAGSGLVSVAAQAPKKAPAAAPAKAQIPPAAKPQAPTPGKAQIPPQAKVQTPPAEPERPAAERTPVVEAFSYRAEGRRDPFLSLLTRSLPVEGRAPLKKKEGLAGVMWDEISLRGIFQGLGGAVALIQAPDNKIYRVRVGDQFYDAVVKAITTDSLVVLQEVNDPLSLQKQRERRKTLHVVDEVIK